MFITVHPIDEDLRFFNKAIQSLKKYFGDNINYFRLSNNATSHYNFLSSLENAPSDSLILFLCHGSTTKIHGCSYRNNLSSHPKHYVHGNFITESNIDLLSKKKIISLSCNSNRLAKAAVSSGSQVFISFDDVFFDQKKFVNNNISSDRVIAVSKWFFRRALVWSIIEAYEGKSTFYEFTNNYRLALKNLQTNLLLCRKDKYSIRIAASLNEISNGIKIYGNSRLKLF